MLHPAVHSPAYPNIIRELARNLERYVAGDQVAFCGEHRVEEHPCVCLRDHAHAGHHRCLCGVEWK